MSFSAQIKTELCRNGIGDKSCAVAECCGILLYCSRFDGEGIRVATASEPFAKRLPKLFKKAFGVTFDAGSETTQTGRSVFSVTDTEKLNAIFDVCGYDRERHTAHHVNFAVLEEEGCLQSFLRGAFLAGGSVSDPEKSYHMELVTEHYYVNREVMSALSELGFRAGSALRGGRYLLYFKNSVIIEDLLTSMGAPVSAMGIMQEKINKSMKNSVNRQINCDEANSDKTVAAAERQLTAITQLRERGELEGLPDKLRETAYLRLENPELSIAQLAEMCDPPVTKSCLNHRLRRLMELAGE